VDKFPCGMGCLEGFSGSSGSRVLVDRWVSRFKGSIG
jgi:hypothetical protein